MPKVHVNPSVPDSAFAVQMKEAVVPANLQVRWRSRLNGVVGLVATRFGAPVNLRVGTNTARYTSTVVRTTAGSMPGRPD